MTPKYIEVQSSLFRESGANVTDESKIDRYAKSMHRARGWGKFPAIHATLHEVSLEDFEDFVEASGDGIEHELAWSRPLDFNDIGMAYASIDDGHHRAYAASRIGIPLRVKKGKKNPAEVLRGRDVAKILASQYGNSRAGLDADYLDDLWIASDHFMLQPIYLDSVASRLAAAQESPSTTQAPIIVGYNQREIFRLEDSDGAYGTPPDVIVLDGNHRWHEAKRRGDEQIMAYVGDRAQAFVDTYSSRRAALDQAIARYLDVEQSSVARDLDFIRSRLPANQVNALRTERKHRVELFRSRSTRNPEVTLEDFLDGSESIPDDEIEGFLSARGLVPIEVVFANGDRVLLIDFDGDRYVLESDGSSFDAKRAKEWLGNKLMHNVGDMVEAEELPDFWQYPPQLYHATQRENYDEIMAKGLGARSRSRVGSNRWVGSSVFTSTDPEAIDAYGDLIFEIDTVGMAQDGVTPQVGLEPGIVEDMQARALAAKIGLYEYDPGVLESGEGLAESTVIIFGHIPPQYLSTPFE